MQGHQAKLPAADGQVAAVQLVTAPTGQHTIQDLVPETVLAEETD